MSCDKTVIDLTNDSNVSYSTVGCKVLPFYMLKCNVPCTTNLPQLELADIICGNVKSIVLMNFVVDVSYLVDACPLLSV